MGIKYFIFLFLYFILFFVLCLVGYHGCVLNKKTICAYLIDLKNKNHGLLVKSNVKMIKKHDIHFLQADTEDGVIDIQINSKEFLNVANISRIYYNEKKETYFLKTVHKDDQEIHVKNVREVFGYKYTLKDRNNIFYRTVISDKTDLGIMSKTIDMYRNPFSGEYFFESEINDKKFLTEEELVNMVPQKLVQYMFDFDALNQMINYQPSGVFKHIKIFGVVSLITSMIAVFIQFLIS